MCPIVILLLALDTFLRGPLLHGYIAIWPRIPWNPPESSKVQGQCLRSLNISADTLLSPQSPKQPMLRPPILPGLRTLKAKTQNPKKP